MRQVKKIVASCTCAIIALSAAALSAAEAREYHCVAGSTYRLPIGVAESADFSDHFCTYPRFEEGSMVARSCLWELTGSVGSWQPTQLILELKFTDRYKAHDLQVFHAKGAVFANLLSVAANQDMCPANVTASILNQHFHRVLLRNAEDRVAIELQLTTPQRLNVSDLFQLRLSYSTANSCSGDLVYHNGSCYAVRHVDRLGHQTAVAQFASLSELRDILVAVNARSKALGDVGVLGNNESVRLPVPYCSSNRSLLLRTQNKCSCGEPVPIPPGSLLPGEGSCLRTWLDPATGDPMFQPVGCTGGAALPTLLSFPSLPMMPGVCGGRGNCTAAAQLLMGHDSCRCDDDRVTTGRLVAIIMSVLAVAVIFLAFLFCRQRISKCWRSAWRRRGEPMTPHNGQELNVGAGGPTETLIELL